jgi:hypothetical protein
MKVIVMTTVRNIANRLAQLINQVMDAALDQNRGKTKKRRTRCKAKGIIHEPLTSALDI